MDLIVDWWNQYRTRAVIFLVGMLMVVIGILVFDVILASQISKKIHIARDEINTRLGRESLGDWPINPINPFDYDLDMMTVIFCGFVSALFYSGLWYCTARKWKQIGVRVPDRKQLNVQQHRIDNEKLERKAEIEDLRLEIDSLQTTVNQCGDQIDEKTRSIKVHQETIAALKESLRIRRVDRAELLERVSQFMNGWCRFLVQSGASENEVENARRIAYETLDQTFEGHYSAE